MKLIFYLHKYQKKQPFDLSMYIGSAQTCPDTFKSAHKEPSK